MKKHYLKHPSAQPTTGFSLIADANSAVQQCIYSFQQGCPDDRSAQKRALAFILVNRSPRSAGIRPLHSCNSFPNQCKNGKRNQTP